MFDWDVNWLAVVVAVVASQVLGFLWYGPLFGKAWMAASGKTREEMGGGGAGAAYAVGMVSALVSAVALALILNLVADPEVAEGLVAGALVGVGFAATSTVTAGAFQETSTTVTWLYVGYQVVMFLLMGAILGGWR